MYYAFTIASFSMVFLVLNQRARAQEESFRINVPSFEESKRIAKSIRFDGLDYDIGTRLDKEARGSFVETLTVLGPKFTDEVGFSKEEKAEFSKTVANRIQARTETMRICRSTLALEGKVSEAAILKAISTIRQEELKHEMILTEKLEEILDPMQLESICKKLMGGGRGTFARVPLVYRFLKLTPEQRSKIELARLAASDLNEKPNDPNQMTALKERVDFLGRDADNSLNAEQFLFVMRALGFVKEGESIRELYEREDEAKRLELRTVWKPFREVQRIIDKKTK